jgi:hypothetical protein
MKFLRAVIFFALACLSVGAWSQPAPTTLEERLFLAIDEGKELVAEGVLTRGKVNLDARNAQGETALHRAIEKGMHELVLALV